MKTLLASILVSAVIVLGFQMIIPFPFGLILGIAIAVIIIGYAMKPSVNPFSLLAYKRADPQNESEQKTQRDTTQRPVSHSKSKYKIIGILALAFGLVNIFWYAPYSLTLVFMNQPFPFQHLQNVEVHDGRGIGTQVSYLPFENAMADPYWLAWSLSLYSGMVILSILSIRSIIQKT